MYQSIKVEIKKNKYIITINRPDVLNSLNEAAISELQNVMEMAIKNNEIRAIIITGAGKKAFVSGGDIKAQLKMGSMAAYKWSLTGHKLMTTIEHSPKPVIAAINGYALGGGCELAVACDLRIASDNAMFGTPEIKIGVICGFGGTLRLPRLIGKTKAKELLMTGKMINAEEAYRLNLINMVVPQDILMIETERLADELADKSMIALDFIKKSVDFGLETDAHTAALHEAELFGLINGTQDKIEGMTAFIEKRIPKFLDK